MTQLYFTVPLLIICLGISLVRYWKNIKSVNKTLEQQKRLLDMLTSRYNRM